MDEFRTLAGKIFIPSFFTLLVSISAIHLVYSFLIYSLNGIFFPAFLFLFTLAVLIIYVLRFSCSWAVDLFIPLILIFTIFLRITSIWNPVSAETGTAELSALVKSVKLLRYSNELYVELKNNTPDAEAGKNITAVCYSEKGIEISPGDELLLNAKPYNLAKTKSRDLSGFELNLLRKGVSCIFYVHKDNLKIINDKPAGIKYVIREVLSGNLEKLFSPKTVPVLKALYFGNKGYIDKATLSDFKRAGVLHVLAASGLHVGILAGAVFVFLLPFLINRKAIVIIISLVILFYLYITDMPVSLFRAFIMYSIFAVQYVFDLERNIFNTLFIAAIVILAVKPYELYSAGFQLSFGATFGIIVFYRFYSQSFSFLPGTVAKTLSATLSAQVLVFPVIYMHMKEINLTGILSNMIIIFTMSVTLVTSLAANVFSVLSPGIGKFTAFLTDGICGISLYLVKLLSQIGGHFFVKEHDYLLLIPYALLLFPVVPVKKIRKAVPAFIIISVVTSWLILYNKYGADKKYAAVMNSDQASLILFNGETNILYGELKTIEAAQILVKYLERNNIRNISLYIPVPDYKNLKSYLYVIKKSIVSDCFISSDFMFSGYFGRFCKTLDTDNIGLKIRDVPWLKSKGVLLSRQNIEEILKSPEKNIDKIPYLLSNNHLLIDNFEDDYIIEYIEN
ncbi:MAG: ComEC/Rec2 family competence protein [Spirochaetes bacterium]|nr:ComEC/Rec2 family competence protein [Spirochaetota bacterium]